MKIAAFAFAVILAVSALSAEPLRVASLHPVMADLARQIGEGRVEIYEVVKPGVDPHLHEPTPVDLRAISRARLVLASGLGLERQLDKLRPAPGKNGPRFVVAGEVVKTIEPGEHDCHGHEDHVADPHWWHSISNTRKVAAQIRDALCEVDSENAPAYTENARKYDARLEELAKWTRLQISSLPRASRVLVTSHDALGYFAADYGFEIHSVQGVSSSDQPSSKKIRELIDFIKSRGVKAVFAENIENPKVLSQITAETGARQGGVLYADGPGSGEASTYEGMMRANVVTIVEALK